MKRFSEVVRNLDTVYENLSYLNKGITREAFKRIAISLDVAEHEFEAWAAGKEWT